MRKITLVLLSLIAVLALLATGCGVDDLEAPELDTEPFGVTDYFGGYMAIGNSLTAGFMDGGLIGSGQADSYPNQIVRAMQTFAGATVTGAALPYFDAPGIGSSPAPEGQTSGVLYTTGGAPTPLGTTATALVPTLYGTIPGTDTAWSSYPAPYNNLGVPGATLADASNATDATNSQSPGNSFFNLILRNPTFGNTTMLEQCVNTAPALVTMWLGNNDVLGGAASGNPVAGVNITPAALFESMYREAIVTINSGVEARTGNTPLIVVANIPNVTDAAYFLDAETTWAGATGGFTNFEEDNVALVLYPALGVLPTLGMDPLGGEYTLTGTEVDLLETTVVAYNAAIDALVTEFDLGFYDANAMLEGLADAQKTHLLLLMGGGLDPATATATTIFSLDGIHPNNHGYEMMAQGFIDAINTALGVALPDAAAAYAWDPTYGNGWTPPPASGRDLDLSYEAMHALDALFLK